MKWNLKPLIFKVQSLFWKFQQKWLSSIRLIKLTTCLSLRKMWLMKLNCCQHGYLGWQRVRIPERSYKPFQIVSFLGNELFAHDATCTQRMNCVLIVLARCSLPRQLRPRLGSAAIICSAMAYFFCGKYSRKYWSQL